MRWIVAIALAGACKPGGVSTAQEVCARAAAMFEKCEDFGSAAPLEHDLMVDRWRGMCRAAFTGETRQLMPNALAVFQALGDDDRAALREQAQCTATASTCDAYRACER